MPIPIPDVKWWVGLNNTGKQLTAGLFMLCIALIVGGGHLYLEMRQMGKEKEAAINEVRKETAAERSRREAAETALGRAEVDCTKEKLAVAEKILQERQKRNDHLEQINEEQKEIIYANTNFVKNTTKTVKQIRDVITEKKQ